MTEEVDIEEGDVELVEEPGDWVSGEEQEQVSGGVDQEPDEQLPETSGDGVDGDGEAGEATWYEPIKYDTPYPQWRCRGCGLDHMAGQFDRCQRCGAG